MSRRKQQHSQAYADHISEYATQSGWTLTRYSEYHYRLFADNLTLDFWTTGKYYVLEDDTAAKRVRGGEKGQLPCQRKAMFKFLTELIFAADLEPVR